MTESSANFKQKTIQNIFQGHFVDDKTKINSNAVKLVTELARFFVLEAATRSAIQAKIDVSDEVMIEHFEKILPQLLLDT